MKTYSSPHTWYLVRKMFLPCSEISELVLTNTAFTISHALSILYSVPAFIMSMYSNFIKTSWFFYYSFSPILTSSQFALVLVCSFQQK